MFGLNKAFRISDNNGKVEFQAINNMEKVMLDDLVGYEIQKRNLLIIQKLSYREERATTAYYLVTAVQVNLQVLRLLLTNTMIRDLE